MGNLLGVVKKMDVALAKLKALSDKICQQNTIDFPGEFGEEGRIFEEIDE